MKIFKKYSYLNRITLFLAVFLFFCVNAFNNLIAQDLFGILPNSTTSYVTASTISKNGDVYITLWGTGVLRSIDSGKTWTPINTGLTNVSLTDIEIISDTEMLVSTMGSGIFKTSSLTNINWVQSNNGITNLNVKTIKKISTGMILIGTYGSGIFKSTDKGTKWTESNKGFFYKDVTVIEEADNGWLVAGTYGGGIYVSRDTSKTWGRQSVSMKNQYINDIKRNKLGYLYAATNGRGVLISVNDGMAWAELDTFMTREFEIKTTPLPDLNATAITFNKNDRPVFGTRFGGVIAEDNESDFTWIPTRVKGIGATTMCQNSNTMYAFFPDAAVHKSNYLGEYWDNANLYAFPLHNYAQDTKVFSIKEKEIYAYYFRNFKKTTDEGKTWTQLANTPHIIYKIAMDSSGIIYAATHTGVYKYNPVLNLWNMLLGNISPENPFIVNDVEIAPNGQIFIITGSNIYYSSNDIDWKQIPFTQICKDIGINYHGDIYVGSGKKAYYSTNNGTDWNSTSDFPSNVTCFGFLSDNTVILGTDSSGLYISSSSNTFQKLSSYPVKTVRTITIDKQDRIFATGNNVLIDELYGTYEASFISSDRGKTFVTINKDFNGEPVGNFTVNKSGDLYMGTSSGMIYRATDRKNLTIPLLVDIPDKALDIDVDAQFRWTSAKRAELYQLQISYDEDFTFVWEGVTQLDTVHNLYGKLDPNHKYFWRVRSKNHEAVSDWSEVRTFMSKLKTPALISPENKAVDVPVYTEMTWENVDGATNYIIQISKKADLSVIAFELNSDTNAVTSPLLEGLTEYFWRVKAKNSTSSSNWSIIWSFKTVFGPPLLISPSDSSTGNTVNPQMVWGKAADINEYDIQISEKEDFSVLIMDSVAIAAKFVISTTLEYDKTYFWRVRSRKGDVVSEWSLMWRFRTGYSPVVLVSPENNAVNVPVKTEFKWEKHISQNKYEIEVAKTADFSNNVIFESLNNLLTYTASVLEAYQDYFWRVRVISDENTGVWSEPFKLKTQVGQIMLRFPANQSENHPVSVNFLWFGTKGAVKYHLQIANDDSFNSLVFSQDTIVSTSHTFPNLMSATDYFWRARAISSEGEGEWSEVWKFKTGNNIPVLILPANGDTAVFNPIKFQWTAVGGALRFELMVSENENFSPNAIEKNDITDNEYTTSELAYPKTYFWKIRAITNEGPTNWSQVWTFTTKDPSGVKDFITLSESEIYPNPADKSVKIKLSETVNSDIHVKMLDMTGKTVFSKNIIPNGNIINLDCSELNPGLYFLVIQSSDKMFKGEIIISR